MANDFPPVIDGTLGSCDQLFALLQAYLRGLNLIAAARVLFVAIVVYAAAVLRPLAEPLLLQVRHEAPEYTEANRLLSFLQWFLPATSQLVPDNSILREFIGGSIMENVKLWQEAPERAAAVRPGN